MIRACLLYTSHDVVQTALHELKQVLTGLTGHSLSLQVSVVELLLQNAVDELDLLLLLQLSSCLLYTSAPPHP